ncbi:MAG: hypothetical protein ACFFB7_08145, partial [Candidatus Sifarchaeia archaeon]
LSRREPPFTIVYFTIVKTNISNKRVARGTAPQSESLGTRTERVKRFKSETRIGVADWIRILSLMPPRSFQMLGT